MLSTIEQVIKSGEKQAVFVLQAFQYKQSLQKKKVTCKHSLMASNILTQISVSGSYMKFNNQIWIKAEKKENEQNSH